MYLFFVQPRIGQARSLREDALIALLLPSQHSMVVFFLSLSSYIFYFGFFKWLLDEFHLLSTHRPTPTDRPTPTIQYYRLMYTESYNSVHKY